MKKNILDILKLENRSDLFGHLIFITIIVAMLGSEYIRYARANLLRKKSIYAIATYTEMVSSGAGPSAKFEYSLAGIKYFLEQDYECAIFSLGRRFYVRVYPDDVTIAKISYLRPVPDSIISQPFNGWKVLPTIDTTGIPEKDWSCLKSFSE